MRSEKEIRNCLDELRKDQFSLTSSKQMLKWVLEGPPRYSVEELVLFENHQRKDGLRKYWSLPSFIMAMEKYPEKVREILERVE